MFANPAGLKFVGVCCYAWGPGSKSDWDLCFGNVTCQLLEPGTSFLLLHCSAEVLFCLVSPPPPPPCYPSPFSGQWEVSHPVWSALHCRVFVRKKVFSLSLKAPSQFCVSTLASLWVFCLVVFFPLSLSPTSGAEIFLQLFGYQEGRGTCYEATDRFSIAAHSLGERSIASLNLHGSLGVLAAAPLQFLPWSGPLLRYIDIVWPWSVVGEKLFMNFFL